MESQMDSTGDDRTRTSSAGREHGAAGRQPDVLILTPVKDAAPHLTQYVAGLESLTYPRSRLSLGILESDSSDETLAILEQIRPRLEQRFARVNLFSRKYNFRIPTGVPRWAPTYQKTRRQILARSRNYLLSRALDEEDWVLWLDVDVVSYPADLIEQLLAVGRDIVHPHCVTVPGGPSFDRNAWRDQGRILLHDLRGADGPVRLDAVGGTALLIKADVHREGLIFPPFPYGVESRLMRKPHPVWGAGEIETEGLGIMAKDMGLECWGLPDLEVIHKAE